MATTECSKQQTSFHNSTHNSFLNLNPSVNPDHCLNPNNYEKLSQKKNLVYNSNSNNLIQCLHLNFTIIQFQGVTSQNKVPVEFDKHLNRNEESYCNSGI